MLKSLWMAVIGPPVFASQHARVSGWRSLAGPESSDDS